VSTVWLSTAEYAAHCGRSDSLIRRFKRQGRLVVDAEGRIDRDASDAKLAGELNPVRGGDRSAPAARPGASASGGVVDLPGVSVAEAVRRERLAKARLAELELGEEAGDLVRRKDAQRAAFTVARQAQERLRTMGSRLRTQLAASSDPRECESLVDAEVRLICDDLQAAAASVAAASRPDNQAA
jgi:hypothetical protein